MNIVYTNYLFVVLFLLYIVDKMCLYNIFCYIYVLFMIYAYVCKVHIGIEQILFMRFVELKKINHIKTCLSSSSTSSESRCFSVPILTRIGVTGYFTGPTYRRESPIVRGTAVPALALLPDNSLTFFGNVAITCNKF